LPASKKPVTHAGWIEAGLILLPDQCGLFLSLMQVGIHFYPMVQVVPNHCIDIGKIKGWILLDDFLSCCAAPEGSDECI
jgi:hypothetical protein